MKRPLRLEVRWEIRWNADKTEGEIWRMFKSRPYPAPPVLEGHIRFVAREEV